MKHAVAANSLTAQRRADQRRKAWTPEPSIPCPQCGRKAFQCKAMGKATGEWQCCVFRCWRGVAA